MKQHLDINEYYKQLQSDDVVFTYKGAVSNDIFDSLLSLLEEKVVIIEDQVKLRRKISVIAVEVLQNIFHHFYLGKQVVQGHDTNTIIFLLAKAEDGGYYIVSGNFIPNAVVENLKERIESVNALSPNDLKLKYREVLSNGEFSDKGGAGLGIIDIARKSGQKLEYYFTLTGFDYTFFSLKVKVQD